MKPINILILILAVCSACTSNKPEGAEANISEPLPSNTIEQKAFQQIIDSAGVEGVVLIYDPKRDTYYSNDFVRCDQGFLPASTFKIPNSIIALETGVVKNDSTLFKWDGTKRAMSIWDRDMILKEAFHYSCVPCYQEIARNIGVERMKQYLKKLDFGNMEVDTSNIDVFWLEGNSRISPRQELDFISRLYNGMLPISERTNQIMKRMMVMEETPSYKLSGKTGWVVRDGFNIGWFVAYLEKEGQPYFVVVNMEPKKGFDMQLFAKTRKEIAMKAFKTLGIIE